MPASNDQWLDGLLESRLEDVSNSVGVSVAVRRGSKTIQASGGFASRRSREVIRPEHRFLGYSTTKSVIASIVLALVDEGELSLDSSLSTWLPEYEHTDEVTLRQLLNHTAGYPDYATEEYRSAVKNHPSTPWSDEKFLEKATRGGLRFEPGSEWEYSNTGYLLLRRTIETVTSGRFSDAVTSLISEPFGLESVFVPTHPSDLQPLVPGYSEFLGGTDHPVDVRGLYHPKWVATGVIGCTAADLAAFYHVLFAGNLLPKRLVTQMNDTVPVPNPDLDSTRPFESPAYGLGVMADTHSRFGRFFGHTGSGPGFSAAAYHFPDGSDRSLTISVLCNFEHPSWAESTLTTIATNCDGSFSRC